MHSFLQKHGADVTGVLSGFDRLLFRGTLRSLFSVLVMEQYLRTNKILMKDFGKHVEMVTRRIKESTVAIAQAAGRPIRYLPSPQTGQEEVAREIARRDGVTSGLIGILSSVEACRSYEIYRNRETKKLALVPRGEFALNGFRHRDLREHLFGRSANAQQKRRQSGKVTRMLRLLRAHGLIRKVPHTHRYVLTGKGRSILVALSAARNASPRKLMELAA